MGTDSRTQIFYFSVVFYYVSLGMIKIAILAQYRRIFDAKMRMLLIIVTIVVALWSIALVLTSVFSCIPVAGFWDKRVRSTCTSSLPQWYINAAGNIATDGLPPNTGSFASQIQDS